MLNNGNDPTNSRSPSGELWQELGAGNHRAMKRCFMTGKQCLFSSKKRNNDNSSKKIFTIMPFSPNLETFYRWSLKPFLTTECGYNSKETQVQRADEVHDLGCIVCEKICRKIQESSLVLAEISIKNQNVFYEIGLAYGLERPIVFMRNANIKEDVLSDPCIEQIINPRTDFNIAEKILEHPNVKHLSYEMEPFRLHHYLYRPWEDRISNGKSLPRELKISALKINQNFGLKETSSNGQDERESRDIDLDFDEVLSGAINVAMNEIKIGSCSEQNEREPWAKAVRCLEGSQSENFLKPPKLIKRCHIN